MRLFAAISLINCFIILFLGDYIYFRDRQNLRNKIFALFCVSLGGWAFTEFMYRNAPTLAVADLWVRIQAFAWPYSVPLFLLFCLVFTKNKILKYKKTLFFILFVPAIIINVVDFFTQLITAGAVKVPWGYATFPSDNLFYVLLSDFWVVSMSILALSLLVRFYFKTTSQKEKKQTLFILVGFFLLLFTASITEIILTVFFSIRVPESLSISFAVFTIIVSLAVTRYELFVINPATAADKIVSTMTDSLVITNAQGNILITNRATAQMLGYSKEELIGKNINVLFKKKEVARQHFRRIFQKKKTVLNHEVDYLTKDRRPISVLLSCSPIYSRRNVLAGAVCVAKNITDRKEVEEAKRTEQIRQVYVDVFYAITGEKLILVTKKELGKYLGKPITAKMPIGSYKELSEARKFIKETAITKLPFVENIDDILLAIQEALTNVIKHVGNGYYQVFEKDNFVQLLIADSGGGIDFKLLSKATLLSGYSTKKTLGVGFDIMLQLSNRILLATDRGGTTIILQFRAQGVRNKKAEKACQ